MNCSDVSPAPSPRADGNNGVAVVIEPPARRAKPTYTKEQLQALAAEADEDDEGR